MNSEQRARWEEFKAKHEDHLWEEFVTEYKEQQWKDFCAQSDEYYDKIGDAKQKSKNLIKLGLSSVAPVILSFFSLFLMSYFNEEMFLNLYPGIAYSARMSALVFAFFMIQKLILKQSIERIESKRVYSGKTVTPEKDIDDKQEDIAQH